MITVTTLVTERMPHFSHKVWQLIRKFTKTSNSRNQQVDTKMVRTCKSGKYRVLEFQCYWNHSTLIKPRNIWRSCILNHRRLTKSWRLLMVTVQHVGAVPGTLVPHPRASAPPRTAQYCQKWNMKKWKYNTSWKIASSIYLKPHYLLNAGWSHHRTRTKPEITMTSTMIKFNVPWTPSMRKPVTGITAQNASHQLLSSKTQTFWKLCQVLSGISKMYTE